MKTCDLCGKNPATGVLGKFKLDHDGSIIPKFFMDVCQPCNDRHEEYQRAHPDND